MKTRDDLMRVSRGFWESRVILTAVELDVFGALAKGPRTAQSVARTIGAKKRGAEILLDALTGMGILRKGKKGYALTEEMQPHLTDGPGSALGMLRHHLHLWESWSRLTDCVKTGEPVGSRSSFRKGPEEARAFTLAMKAGAQRLAPGVAEEMNLKGRKHLLDLGGGPGVYAACLARKNPGLRVTIVDLPHVAAVGAEMLSEYPDVKDRLDYHAADLATDPLPAGADAAFLSHVIHGDPEKKVKALFRKVARALVPGGLFVVRDFFLSPDRTAPPSASIFSLNMLVNTDGGRSYSAKEVIGWLKQAGFATAVRKHSKAAPDAPYVLARK